MPGGILTEIGFAVIGTHRFLPYFQVPWEAHLFPLLCGNILDI